MGVPLARAEAALNIAWAVSDNELWHILGEIAYWLAEDMQNKIRGQVSLKIAEMTEGELIPTARPSRRLPPVLVWRVRGLLGERA